ncbi:MAG: hypothetical protein IJX76_03630 [Clostridia bacterium]|nr:hypothetical protein [Clostridia bacterium]
MKKFLSVVLVAAMMTAALVSCAGESADNTTTADSKNNAATTTVNGVQTTPTVTPPTTVTNDVNPDEVIEVPKLPGDGLEELLEGLTKAEVDLSQLGVVDFDAWNDNENMENLDKLFDGIKTEVDFVEAGHGKCGGDAKWGAEAGGYFYFALTEATTLKAYVITTGNDNLDYPGRNPVEWTLYGTNDAEAFTAGAAAGLNNNPSGGDDTRVTSTDIPFDESKWTKLDYVYDGGIAEGNFLENGYEIDADKQGEFQYYVWVLGYTKDGNFQACEFELYK